MESGIDRRKFLRIAGGAFGMTLIGTLPRIEAQEAGFRVFGSTLTREEIAEQKESAAKSLRNSIPEIPTLDYLREYASNLEAESQMYIPEDMEVAYVTKRSSSRLHELARNILPDSYGLFIFADISREGRRTQRLYVLKRIEKDAVQFVKAYAVSMARKGFSNTADSDRTPLGLHKIHSGQLGIFGEVVSGLNKFRERFLHLNINDRDHWFVRGFGLEADNAVAEVVTDQYLLEGPHTGISRGIRIHGTNRSGQIARDGTWRSFLGGRRQSGGCIRMANTDIRDLSISSYVPLSLTTTDKEKKPTVSVMIHATQAAIDATGIYDD